MGTVCLILKIYIAFHYSVGDGEIDRGFGQCVKDELKEMQ
jgi:hypothetical protein